MNHATGSGSLSGFGRIVGAAAHQRLAPDEGRAALRQARALLVGPVNVRGAPDVGDAGGDGVVLQLRNDRAAGRVGVPAPVVAHERSAQDVLAEVHGPAVDLVGEGPAEAVVAGPERDDRLPGVEVIHDVLLLVVGQGQEAGEEDDEVRQGEVLEAGDVVRLELRLPALLGVDRHGRVDLALRIESEQHRAVKSVVFAQDPGHHRHGLLAAVFLVGRDQDDVPALAGSVTTGIGQPAGAFGHGMRDPPAAGEHEDHGKEQAEQGRWHDQTTGGSWPGISTAAADVPMPGVSAVPKPPGPFRHSPVSAPGFTCRRRVP